MNLHLGWCYYTLSLNKIERDSAYNYYLNAKNIFHKIENKQMEAEVLGYIGMLFMDFKINTRAEGILIKSINLLKTLPKTEDNLNLLWDKYNKLGSITHDQKLYGKALEYYNKALITGNKLSDNYRNHLFININIAEVYEDKKEFEKSIAMYQQLLKDDPKMFNKDPMSYAAVFKQFGIYSVSR